MMKQTTLCYIERDEQYLMLHRTKKKNDENAGKWVGVGGKLEEGESPEDCAVREIGEETGLCPRSLEFRGMITFVSDEWGTEYMYLFTCCDFTGEIRDCDEGELCWIPVKDAAALPVWEGDRIFLGLLRTRREFFSLKLCYHGDVLTEAFLDGKKLLI